MNGLNYRAYVDGLRAVAVLPVLFFHADLGFSGGYVGVDIFFVISGFLITGLILRDLEDGQFSIVKFWERRVRRIMPALAVVVLATLVAGWFLLLPQGFKELGESAVAQALLVSNIYFWIKSWIGAGYFAPAAEVKPLLHTWSLAVEEQFYLVFPFVLLVLKRLSRNLLIPAILLLGCVSFALSVYCSYHYPSANFYFLPTRAWELLAGAFLAALPAQQRVPSRALAETLSWAGLISIFIAVFCYDKETRFPGASALLPCLGAAVIIWANGPGLTTVGKLLALRPVVFVGLISYSLYLWHWPLLVFFKHWAIDPIPPGQRSLLLLASMVLAVLSWKFVETPFRQRSVFKARPRIFAFAAATTAVMLLAGAAIFKLQGFPSRLPADALRYLHGERRCVFDHDLSLKQAQAGQFFELAKGCETKPIELIVWGDSHAMAVMPVIEQLCKEYSVRGVAATHSATAPLVGYRSAKSELADGGVIYSNAVMDFICSQGVQDVIIAANWSVYMNDTIGDNSVSGCLSATIEKILPTGARIWILTQVPKQNWDVPAALAVTVWRGEDPDQIGLPLEDYHEEYRRQTEIFDGLDTRFDSVTILDPGRFFITGGRCRVTDQGAPLYCDNNHLSTTGAMLLRPLFEPIFKGGGK